MDSGNESGVAKQAKLRYQPLSGKENLNEFQGSLENLSKSVFNIPVDARDPAVTISVSGRITG